MNVRREANASLPVATLDRASLRLVQRLAPVATTGAASRRISSSTRLTSARQTAKLAQLQKRRSVRRGYTLLEMVISTGAATVLLVGMMSTIVVANRAWSPDLKPAIKTEASGLTRQLSIDLRGALCFTERTATAATFTVPDRDSDGQPEVLRYAWSGTAGDPLTVSLNGGAAQVVVADVQTFNMDYLLRSVVAPIIPTSDAKKTVLFITAAEGVADASVDRNTLPTGEKERIEAIESWGFNVDILSMTATDAEFTSRYDESAVVYVPSTVSSDEVAIRLYYTNLGVVFEQSNQRVQTGVAKELISGSGNQIDLENTNHYITSELSPGIVDILSTTQPILAFQSEFAPDLQILARSTMSEYSAALAVLDVDARTTRAEPTPGRRVLLPWGAEPTPFNLLTNSALSIMKRSISWTAGLDNGTARRRILYLVQNTQQLSEQNFDRKIMFESAGLEVRLLNQTTDSGSLSSEISQSAALYLSPETSPKVLLSSVVDVPQGVMCESAAWLMALGFADNTAGLADQDFDVKDSAHPIVNGFFEPTITILNLPLNSVVPSGTLANGLTTVLETSSRGKGSAIPVVVTLEQQTRRVDDSDSPGRRTLVPFYSARRSTFTADGYRLMQQAMDWTALKPVTETTETTSFSQFLRSFSQ